MHGIEGLEVDDSVLVDFVRIFQAAHDREVDGILTISAGGESCGEDDFPRT